ncbi:hypothetical protein E4582_02230 [Luteimonas yindakuii]|uniref:Uncharacterized protein n=1 Tax=Luteimonas yindakuii TaxID=2565782 RepID=A0A4Z1R232_9GAMM|nr:hypothetical protein [Luteimonas yindakuii]TKS53704.1 hypothetical protein E4582_02230 [Luteimonas yindakuii]
MERIYDFKTTAELNRIASNNREFANQRLKMLREEHKAILDRIAAEGRTEELEIELLANAGATKEMMEFSVGKAKIHRVTVAYKAWLVFKPLIIWPLSVGLLFAATLILMFIVQQFSEDAATLVMLGGFQLSGMLFGLASLAGTVVAVIRLFSSRETLFTQLPDRVKPRFTRDS